MTEPNETDDEQSPAKKDKREVVEKNDSEESAHIADGDAEAPEETVPLIEGVSEEVSPMVE